jgi:hypothetical protein
MGDGSRCGWLESGRGLTPRPPDACVGGIVGRERSLATGAGDVFVGRGSPVVSFGKMVQRSSLVNNVGKVDPERSRRTCGWGDAAAGEQFGFCGIFLLMQRRSTKLTSKPNNRFDPSLRSGDWRAASVRRAGSGRQRLKLVVGGHKGNS